MINNNKIKFLIENNACERNIVIRFLTDKSILQRLLQIYLMTNLF